MKTLREGCFLYIWVALLIFSVSEVIWPIFARAEGINGAARLNPIADQSCRLSASHRRARVAFLHEQLRTYQHDLGTAEESLEVFKDSLDSMNSAYLASKVCLGIAIVAGTIAGVTAVYEVFFAGEALSVFGLSFRLGTSRIVTGTTATLRLFSLPAGIYFVVKGARVYADASLPIQLDELKRDQVASLRHTELLTEGAVNFLSSPSCSGTRCPVVQPDIENAWRGVYAWHDEASRRLEAENRWWRFEAFSHLYGRTLAEVEIPWIMNVVELLKMKIEYTRLLLHILSHDSRACAR